MTKEFSAMLKDVLYQDLSTWKYTTLYDKDYIFQFCVQEIIYKHMFPMQDSDFAALYRMFVDFSGISIEERYELFKACKDDVKKDWYRTAYDMAHLYVKNSTENIRSSISEQTFRSSVRKVKGDSNTAIKNDPTLLVLMLEDSKLVPSNLYSHNPNLVSVTLKNVGKVESMAFYECPALDVVYIEGSTEIGNGAFPKNTRIIRSGGAAVDTKELDAAKEEIKRLKAELDAAPKPLPVPDNHNELMLVHEEIERLKKELEASVDQKKYDDAVAEVTKLKSDLAAEQGKTKELNDVVFKQTEYARKATEELDTCKKQLEEEKAKGDITALTEEKEKLSKDVSDRDEKIKTLEFEKTRLDSVIEQYEEQVKTQNTNLGLVEADKETLSAKLKEAEANLETFKQVVADMNLSDNIDTDSYSELLSYVDKDILQAYAKDMGDKQFQTFTTEQNRIAKRLLAQGIPATTPPTLPSTIQYKSTRNIESQYPLIDKFFNTESITYAIENDPSYEKDVFIPEYEKACTLFYKYGVQEAVGKNFDDLLTQYGENVVPTSDLGYIQAMRTLKMLADSGRLSIRHVAALKEVVEKVYKEADKHEEILKIIEAHGYEESDYKTLYEECKHFIPPVEVKYTDPKDMDGLIASYMEKFLSGRAGGDAPVEDNRTYTMEEVEQAVRDHLGLDNDADISAQMKSLRDVATTLGDMTTDDPTEMMKHVHYLS